jgi:exonuclease SbcD
MRYAGAPLPMSFSEKDYHRGVTLIKLTEAGTTIDRLAFEAPVKLLSIPLDPQPLPVVLEELSCLPEGEITESSPIIEIKILITEPEPAMRHRIESVLSGKSVRIGPIRTLSSKSKVESAGLAYDASRVLSPLEIALDRFRRLYGGEEMPVSMRELLSSVIKEVSL